MLDKGMRQTGQSAWADSILIVQQLCCFGLGGHRTRHCRPFKEMPAHIQTLELGRPIETSGAKKISRAIESHLAFAYDIEGPKVEQCGISVDIVKE